MNFVVLLIIRQLPIILFATILLTDTTEGASRKLIAEIYFSPKQHNKSEERCPFRGEKNFIRAKKTGKDKKNLVIFRNLKGGERKEGIFKDLIIIMGRILRPLNATRYKLLSALICEVARNFWPRDSHALVPSSTDASEMRKSPAYRAPTTPISQVYLVFSFILLQAGFQGDSRSRQRPVFAMTRVTQLSRLALRQSRVSRTPSTHRLSSPLLLSREETRWRWRRRRRRGTRNAELRNART